MGYALPFLPYPLMSSNSLTLIVVVRFAIFFFPRNCLWNGNHDCERSSPASLRTQAKQRGFLAELKSPAMVMMKLLNITPGKIATDAWREDSSRFGREEILAYFCGENGPRRRSYQPLQQHQHPINSRNYRSKKTRKK